MIKIGSKTPIEMEADECPICYCELTPYDRITIYCNHTYHYKCIGAWFEKNHSNICPLCRLPNEIDTNPEMTIFIDRILVKMSISMIGLPTDLNKLIKEMIRYGEETSLPFERQGNTILGRLLYVSLMNTDTIEMKVRLANRLASLKERNI